MTYTAASIREISTLSAVSFRSMCIENNWCDDCDNAEYSAIFSLFEGKNLKKSNILTLAIAVVRNSSNLTDEDVLDVMYSIRRRVFTTYEKR